MYHLTEGSGGMAQAICGANQAVKQSGWSAASGALGEAIEQLQERLNTLEARLEPILHSATPTKCEGERERDSMPLAPLLAEMKTHILRVVSSRDQVNDLIQRLEI